ncbi:MAG: hypothetical protein WD906_07060 [Anaerolineales bacterium]
MGTSGSHPSPRTPSWRIAAGLLGSATPPARQSQEIWRAAASDEQAAVADGLSDPIIAEACRIADKTDTPSNAVGQFEDLALASNKAGLFFEMAKRALARAVLENGGSPRFSQELFSELVSYYASSDLSGLVGGRGRVPTISDSISLKDRFRAIARDSAAKLGPPPTDSRQWSNYVTKVLEDLQGRGSL